MQDAREETFSIWPTCASSPRCPDFFHDRKGGKREVTGEPIICPVPQQSYRAYYPVGKQIGMENGCEGARRPIKSVRGRSHPTDEPRSHHIAPEDLPLDVLVLGSGRPTTVWLTWSLRLFLLERSEWVG
jgi:hypothetical protein